MRPWYLLTALLVFSNPARAASDQGGQFQTFRCPFRVVLNNVGAKPGVVTFTFDFTARKYAAKHDNKPYGPWQNLVSFNRNQIVMSEIRNESTASEAINLYTGEYGYTQLSPTGAMLQALAGKCMRVPTETP